MANMVYHEIYCEGIRRKLFGAGVICEKVLTSRTSPQGRFFPYVLDYSKCAPADWAAEKAEILERGVVDCSKRGPDGNYGLRRDYTEEEQSELGYYPVSFDEGGDKMSWLSKWTSNEDVAFYASKALPDETIIFCQEYEGEYDGGCYLKNGEKIIDKPIAPNADNDISVPEALKIASDALKEAGLEAQAKEMEKRVKADFPRTYAMSIILDYVDCERTEAVEEEIIQLPF